MFVETALPDINISPSTVIYPSPRKDATYHLDYAHEFGFIDTKDSFAANEGRTKDFLLLVTASGRGKMRYNRINYQLNVGTVAFIDCQKPSYFESLGNWKFYFVCVRGIRIADYFKQFSNNPTQPSRRQVVFNTDITLNLVDKIKAMIYFDQHAIFDEITTSGIIDYLISTIMINKFKAAPDHVETSSGIMKDIKAFLEANYTEKVTLTQLAHEFNLSTSLISKKFKNQYHVSPKQFLNDLRIAKAKQLLTETDLSSADICPRVGIEDTTYFIRFFKRYTGMTPRAYQLAAKDPSLSQQK